MVTAITYTTNFVREPLIVGMLHNNSAIKATGTSDNIYIGDAKHIDVFVVVGTETGTAIIQYHINVLESTSGTVVKTYDGTSLSATGVDYISVDGLTLGDYVNITWTGTLDGSNYFSGCYCKIVVKR